MIVGGFLSRVHALPDTLGVLGPIEIRNKNSANFILTHGRGDSKFDDAAKGNDLPGVRVGGLNNEIEFFLRRAAVAFQGTCDQAEAMEGDPS